MLEILHLYDTIDLYCKNTEKLITEKTKKLSTLWLFHPSYK